MNQDVMAANKSRAYRLELVVRHPFALLLTGQLLGAKTTKGQFYQSLYRRKWTASEIGLQDQLDLSLQHHPQFPNLLAYR
jgi:hypothetical protein